MNKLYTFWFHYNKPASKLAGSPKLTVHFKDKCYLVDKVICNVPTHTFNRATQPHCVVKGRAKEIEFGKSTLNGKLFAGII